jgi:plasmid stabilization system protein ParE
MNRYNIDSRAQAELEKSIRYYRRAGGSQLARRFLTEFQRVRDLIRRNPGLGHPVEGADLQKFGLTTFPFSIIYEFKNSVVTIVVLAHHSQHPDYWRDRI